MYYLYLKTHNFTELKYLGQTQYDPFKYKGSGKIWKNHIKQYGNDVTTEILAECETKEDMVKLGLYYSKLWNIVENKDFANKIPEKGAGGGSGILNGMYGKPSPNRGVPQTPEQKTKQSLAMKKLYSSRYKPWNKGKTGIYSEETLNKYRKPKSEETKKKLREASLRYFSNPDNKLKHSNIMKEFYK